MSEPNTTRKLRVRMPQTIPISTATVTDTIAESLRRSWGHLRNAPKLLARQIEANERTASNLLEGKNAPSATTLIKLMAEDDEVFAAILELAGRQVPGTHQSQIEAIKNALRIMEGKS
jgi:uroporphyrinogen-III decarboxylase